MNFSVNSTHSGKILSFYVTQILREINFIELKRSKKASLAILEALKFDLGEFVRLGRAEIS